MFQTAPYKCGDAPADGLRAGGDRKTEGWRQNGIFQASAGAMSGAGTRVFPRSLFALFKIPVAKFLRPARRLLAGIPVPFHGKRRGGRFQRRPRVFEKDARQSPPLPENGDF